MINFKKTGQGPHLLLIHGFCESLDMWDHWVPTLAQYYTVYTIDLPGFGQSPLLPHTTSLESIAVAICDWMEEVDMVNPVIIGHSLGGYVTLALAELMGIHIRAIGLFHSTAFADTEEKIHSRNKTYRFIQKFGVEKFIDSFVPPLFSEENRSRKHQEIQRLISFGKLSNQASVLAFILAMRDRKNRMEIWQNFPNPKLMIAGLHDQAVHIEQSRQHKPYAFYYHELPNAGHMGMFEEEDTCLEIIQSFLKNLS
ncbi:alpha/beta fold hydrolase [Mongoliitalea daihaiensis]|uniref:alpha/beta fold hydrolase n=1 Tax=Mongoliitalea daihaiensis TaxID=2782006 RepID=UPI0021D43AC4|nr:alpha/beta hydrolase [Mongoliitalea daihaiensis]UJP66257.1 alpha/beta hydrolase [Mongoliitalea daihaiensis]